MQRDRTVIRTDSTTGPTIGAPGTATVRLTTAISSVLTTVTYRHTATGNTTSRRIARPTRTATNKTTTAAAIADTDRRRDTKQAMRTRMAFSMQQDSRAQSIDKQGCYQTVQRSAAERTMAESSLQLNACLNSDKLESDPITRYLPI